jgi:hypothetical protein
MLLSFQKFVSLSQLQFLKCSSSHFCYLPSRVPTGTWTSGTGSSHPTSAQGTHAMVILGNDDGLDT